MKRKKERKNVITIVLFESRFRYCVLWTEAKALGLYIQFSEVWCWVNFQLFKVTETQSKELGQTWILVYNAHPISVAKWLLQFWNMSNALFCWSRKLNVQHLVAHRCLHNTLIVKCLLTIMTWFNNMERDLFSLLVMFW